MPLTLSDDTLADLKMGELEARIEIACRLYDADKLSKPAACRLTGLSRGDFEDELTKRGLPWIRVNWDEGYALEFDQIAGQTQVAGDNEPTGI